MKKNIIAVTATLILTGVAFGAAVHDWHDLDAVHKHVMEAQKEMDRARAKNHYDMDGHGAKAEELLRQAEHELNEAVESAKRAK